MRFDSDTVVLITVFGISMILLWGDRKKKDDPEQPQSFPASVPSSLPASAPAGTKGKGTSSKKKKKPAGKGKAGTPGIPFGDRTNVSPEK